MYFWDLGLPGGGFTSAEKKLVMAAFMEAAGFETSREFDFHVLRPAVYPLPATLRHDAVGFW